MNRRTIGVGLCVVCALAGGMVMSRLAWSQVQSAAEPAAKYGKANAKRIEAYIVLLRLRQDLYLRWKETGTWPDDKEANVALGEHSKYWAKKLGDGHAIFAGGMKGEYWDNAAIIVIEAESEEQAQQIVKEDPAVKAYVFQAQVRPFDVSYISDKYCRKE